MSTELEVWLVQARDLCDPDGTIVKLIHEAQVALEQTYRGKPADALVKADQKVLTAFWACVGAFEAVRYSYRQINRPDDPELLRWSKFREMAGICLHNMGRLDEELRLYLQRSAARSE